MIILASGSPRRKEIMELVGLDFEVIVSHYDENHNDWPENKEEIAETMAVHKALDVAVNHPNDIVIGADTVVMIDGEILGKPIDKKDAFIMLQKLAGKRHEVITGVCLKSNSNMVSFSSTTFVDFYEMTDQEIFDYIETNEPMDKAGAYAIQGVGEKFIKGIDGDFYTVMGLPIAQILRELKNFQ